MKKAYVFPGQGAQFPGMGQVWEQHPETRRLLEEADAILGFSLSKIMFSGSAAELSATKVTQPAIFVHSAIAFTGHRLEKADMMAGHSLGEISALFASGVLDFGAALRLVSLRAQAMQQACEAQKSTMAAVLGLPDERVVQICEELSDIVVAANFNCPNQVVISGTIKGIGQAEEKLKAAGAKRVLPLPVSGAFHSPLMRSAQESFAAALDQIPFSAPECPIYQNISAQAVTDPALLKANLIRQITGSVRWTQSIQQMIKDGAHDFTEIGPGKVLQGLILKTDRGVTVTSID